MIDDGEHNSDENTVIVLQVKLDEYNRINSNSQVFGYTQEWSEDSNSYLKYTFILDFEQAKAVQGKMNYCGWDNKTDNRLNIHKKEIKENELFTWFESLEEDGEQVVYKIDRVSHI